MILQTFGKKDSYKLQFHQIKVKLSWQSELKWGFYKLGKTFLILEKRKTGLDFSPDHFVGSFTAD